MAYTEDDRDAVLSLAGELFRARQRNPSSEAQLLTAAVVSELRGLQARVDAVESVTSRACEALERIAVALENLERSNGLVR
jgi:hypothetical protein